MNCLEWLPIYFGILKMGALAVPMNYRYTADEIKYCLELSDARVLVFGPEFIGRVETIFPKLKGVDSLFYVGENVPTFADSYDRLVTYCCERAPEIEIKEDDYAAIYFSSGTTGFPKAILHSHAAVMSACETEQNHHSQTRDDVFLCIPAALPHRCKNALVRKPAFRQPGGFAAGRETGMDYESRVGRGGHHCVAVGAVGAGHFRRH